MQIKYQMTGFYMKCNTALKWDINAIPHPIPPTPITPRLRLAKSNNKFVSKAVPKSFIFIHFAFSAIFFDMTEENYMEFSPIVSKVI